MSIPKADITKAHRITHDGNCPFMQGCKGYQTDCRGFYSPDETHTCIHGSPVDGDNSCADPDAPKYEDNKYFTASEVHEIVHRPTTELINWLEACFLAKYWKECISCHKAFFLYKFNGRCPICAKKP